MSAINLLHETEESLALHHKTWEDVCWIGLIDDSSRHLSIAEFKRQADRHYDNGHTLVRVVEELVIVGRDWWLSREIYEGAEWWRFHTVPLNTPTINSQPFSLFKDGASYD